MLESKQNAPFCYSLDLYGSASIPHLLRKFQREIHFLVTPEDTTGQNGRRGEQPISFEVSSNTRNLIKVVFWVVVSITISIAMGQLK